MISITYSEIPYFLRCGSFFESLSALEKNEEIQVPERCFAWDGTVDNIDEFRKIMNVTAFWGLDEIPTSLISFCSSSDTSILTTAFMDEEYAELGFAQDLLEIFVPSATATPHHRLAVAIKLGRSEVVKYLASVLVDDFLARKAVVQGGHLGCIDLLLEYSHLALDVFLISDAAFWGHLHIVEYLHQRGCPWDWQVPKEASRMGYFDIFLYAMENGCDCAPDAVMDAVQSVCASGVQGLKYLIEHRGLPVPCKGLLLMEAFIRGNYLALEYLFTIGPGVTNISEDAVVRSTWKLKFQTAYYDSDDYDLDLSKCIECAFRNHFDIFTEIPELVSSVKGIDNEMPLCNALLRL
eukprot:gene8594-10183_t